MELVQKDTTSKIVEVFLRDSTTGQGKTGVAAASMSGDYTDPNGSATSLSFATGAVGDPYSVGKWAEAGGGKYYFHAPNGMFDAFGTVCARFSASGAIDAKREYQIVAFDPNAIADLGLTALDGHTPQTGDTYALASGATGFTAIDTVVDSILAGINNGTYGLSALRTLIAAIQTDLDNGTDGLGALAALIAAVDGDTDALLGRLTASRAGYLDNLSAGAVATQASVDTLTNAVRCQIVAPTEYQLPASGDERFKLTVLVYSNDAVSLEDPDSNTVTVAVENAAGTSRSGNLYDAATAGSATTTMNRVDVGHYELWYEVGSADAEEQLNWLISYTESSNAMKGAAQTTLVAIASGGGFNSSDRAMLTTVNDDWSDGGRLDNILDGRAAPGDAMTLTSATRTKLDATQPDYAPITPVELNARTLLAASYATETNQTAMLNRLGAWTGSARNTILGAFQALFRKDVDATVPSDVNDDLGSGPGTADNTTDSTEAIRDRGDVAYLTGAGGAPPDLLQSTTIATLASQTSFTLAAGSADDDAYNGATVIITDSATSTQKAVATVSDYTGSTKTVTLSSDPAVFTMAAGDSIAIVASTGSAGGGGGDATLANQTSMISTLASVKAKTDLITASNITVVSPVATDGSLSPIIIGDDYLASDGRAISWTFDLAGVDVTGAVAWLGVSKTHRGSFLVQGTVTDNGGGSVTVAFDLLSSHTSNLLPDDCYEYDMTLKTSSGNRITTIEGTVKLHASSTLLAT